MWPISAQCCPCPLNTKDHRRLFTVSETTSLPAAFQAILLKWDRKALHKRNPATNLLNLCICPAHLLRTLSPNNMKDLNDSHQTDFMKKKMCPYLGLVLGDCLHLTSMWPFLVTDTHRLCTPFITQSGLQWKMQGLGQYHVGLLQRAHKTIWNCLVWAGVGITGEI